MIERRFLVLKRTLGFPEEIERFLARDDDFQEAGANQLLSDKNAQLKFADDSVSFYSGRRKVSKLFRNDYANFHTNFNVIMTSLGGNPDRISKL